MHCACMIKWQADLFLVIQIIIFIFICFFFLTVASTPDWVAEFAEKQAQREAEDRIKVSKVLLLVFFLLKIYVIVFIFANDAKFCRRKERSLRNRKHSFKESRMK